MRFVVSAPEGEMLSQFVPPLWTDAPAVKLVVVVALTVRLCEAGAVPPTVALKAKDVGANVSVPAAGPPTSLTPYV